MTQPHQSREFEPLVKAARPTIYQTNAFRLLGLPVDASSSEISRRFQKLEMMHKLGVTEPTRANSVLSPVGVSLSQIHDARQRMTDPQARVIEEFFWFWPVKPDCAATDEALRGLESGDEEGAMDVWVRRSKESADSASIHNLAVLNHLRFLDGISSASPNLECLEAKANQAWDYWLTLLEMQAFWTRLAARIASYGDPRLSEETVGDIRASLLPTLLQIDVTLAVTAAEAGDFSRASVHIDVLRRSGCPADVLLGRMEGSLEHVRTRITHLCARATTAVTESVDDTPVILKKLLRDSAPAMKILTELAGTRSRLTDSAGDAIACAVRESLIPFANKTEKWDVCEPLLNRVQPLATGTALTLQVAEDLATVRKNADAKRIWGDLTPIDNAPSLSTINGIGFALYGQSDPDPHSQSHASTYYFTFFFLPIFPICRYRVISTGNGYRFLGKLPLRTYDKWHLGTVLGLLVLFLVLAASSNNSSRSNSSYNNDQRYPFPSTSTTPAPIPSATTQREQNETLPSNRSVPDSFIPDAGAQSSLADSAVVSLDSSRTSVLKQEIDAAKARLRFLSSTYEQCQQTLASYDGQTASDKSRIEGIESSIKLGLPVDDAEYRRTLDRHNSNVVLYNSTLISCKATAAEHDALLESANAKVAAYNRLIGAK